MWCSPISSPSALPSHGTGRSFAEKAYSSDSSPDYADSRRRDPYSLFASPGTRSPPTPYESARQRGLAKRRQAKRQREIALKSVADRRQTDEAGQVAPFRKRPSENEQRRLIDSPIVRQDRFVGRTTDKKLFKTVSSRTGKRSGDPLVVAGADADKVNESKTSSQRKRGQGSASTGRTKRRGRSSSRVNSTGASGKPLEERRDQNSCVAGPQRRSRARDPRHDPVPTDDAQRFGGSAGGGKVFRSDVIMPAMASGNADLQALPSLAMEEPPLLLESARYVNNFVAGQGCVEEKVDALHGHCGNGGDLYQDSGSRLTCPQDLDEIDAFHDGEVCVAEQSILCATSTRRDGYRGAAGLPERTSRLSSGTVARRNQIADLNGARAPFDQPISERRRSAGSRRGSNGNLLASRSELHDPVDEADVAYGKRSDEVGHSNTTHNAVKTSYRRLVDECTERHCYVVLTTSEEISKQVGVSRTQMDGESSKTSIKRSSNVDRPAKRPSDGENFGNYTSTKKFKKSANPSRTKSLKTAVTSDEDVAITRTLPENAIPNAKKSKTKFVPRDRLDDTGTKNVLPENFAGKSKISNSRSDASDPLSDEKAISNVNTATPIEAVAKQPKKQMRMSKRKTSSPLKRTNKFADDKSSEPPRPETSAATNATNSSANAKRTPNNSSKSSPKKSTTSASKAAEFESPQAGSSNTSSAELILISDLECSIDETLAGVVSRRGSPTKKVTPRKKVSPTSNLRISVKSLFRKSFSRLEEKRESIIAKAFDCQPCVVQLERIEYEKVLPLVFPEYPVSFTYLLNSWDIEIVSKISEGSFSEVFRVCKVEPPADDDSQTEYVIKVVPVGKVGQPKFDDLLPEMHMCLAGRVLLESEFNRAPTFIGLLGIHLVQGQYTNEMATVCQNFAIEFPHEAEHPLPNERPIDQYFIVFFTSYDGHELEKVLPTLTLDQKCSIILQITFGLAAAECAFDFEHRDMHLSNLVVSDYRGNASMDDGDVSAEDSHRPLMMIEFRIEGTSYWVNSFGKKVALIDYGMSRLVVDETLYTSFSSSILEGANLQRRTYREQHHLLGGVGNYRAAMPETNGLWIKFLICKMFRKRPVNPTRARYATLVNRLYDQLNRNAVSARDCLDLLAGDDGPLRLGRDD